MGDRYLTKPTHKNATNTVKAKCENCLVTYWETASSYNRKKRHFHSAACYAMYREFHLPREEQNAYGTGHSPEERAKRRKARSTLNHHLRDKGLERPSCEVCGAKAEAHHDDYDKPLDVRWLCFKHHRAHHKAVHENPELLNA